jgi:hypothetical protein
VDYRRSSLVRQTYEKRIHGWVRCGCLGRGAVVGRWCSHSRYRRGGRGRDWCIGGCNYGGSVTPGSSGARLGAEVAGATVGDGFPPCTGAWVGCGVVGEEVGIASGENMRENGNSNGRNLLMLADHNQPNRMEQTLLR